jgi:hypothetical protein
MQNASTERPAKGRMLPAGARPWLRISILAAILAIIGNAIGLSVPSIYASLTPAFLPQALAQDIASLCVVAPLWIIAAVLALRGSARAYLLWLGVLVFTVYNYSIYTFSVPFGPLFPVWVAVLGMALYALIGGLTSMDHEAARLALRGSRAVRVTAWALLILGVLFALLWLSEDVPALIAGATPASVRDMGLPTNPVHILDLSFFLPAAFMTGIWLLRDKPLAYSIAPAMIVFLILTGIPILITPAVMQARGEASGWGIAIPIGGLTVLLLALLIRLLSSFTAVRGGN